MYETLVFSGGGLKGLAFVGCLKALEELGLMSAVHTLVGTSFGSIVGLMIALGYGSDELVDFVYHFKYSDFQDIQILQSMSSYGLDTGKRIEQLLRAMLKRKLGCYDITFEQLRQQTGKRLVVAVTCLNSREIQYLDPDDHPDFSVVTGVRMSMSLPVLFVPVVHEERHYVDGGLIDNFPIHVGSPGRTLGFRFTEESVTHRITSIHAYLVNLLACVYQEVNRLRQVSHTGRDVVFIDPGSVTVATLNPTHEQREGLYQNGHQQASEFLVPRVVAKELLDQLLEQVAGQ